MVITMKKKGKLQLEYSALLSFVIAQCCHKFHFYITLSHAHHLAATDIANICSSLEFARNIINTSYIYTTTNALTIYTTKRLG